MAGNVCDVCQKTGDTYVCCSRLGPMSLAYCADCYNNASEPHWLLCSTIDMIGGPEATHPYVLGIITYIDGKYVEYPEWWDNKPKGWKTYAECLEEDMKNGRL